MNRSWPRHDGTFHKTDAAGERAMCGIAGFLGPWPVSLLQHMVAAVAHRGPDGEGVFHDPAAGIALGHRRLSIIDTTAGGAQPMTTPDGRFVVTFNGEIYNYRELRAELAGAGLCFRTASDTEVLLHGFARFGSSFFPKLRGIFGAAFWDVRERRLTLVRDSVGVNIRVGGSQLAGTSPSFSLPRRLGVPGMPLPEPPKKLSSAEKTTVGSIVTIENPRRGLIRMVLTASGARRSLR